MKAGKEKIGRYWILFLLVFASCSNSPRNALDKKDIMLKGSGLFEKNGCAVCHSIEGEIVYGPPLNDLFMKQVKVIRNGKEIVLTADRKYLKRAIMDPRFEKVSDYRNKDMPVPLFTDEEAEILVEYIVALGSTEEK